MSQRDSDLIYEAYIAENSTPGLDIEKIKSFFSREDANNPGYWDEMVMPAIEEYMRSGGGGGLHFPEGNPYDADGLERYLDSLKNPLTHGVRRLGSAVRDQASKLGNKIKSLPRPSLQNPIKFNKR
jgi:hypothetical protein